VPIDWVWGVDVATGEPIRVPADVVRPGRPGELIVHCTSSGAACHTSFVHAVLSGLYELIERDAFSIMWMSQLAMPRVAQVADPLGVGAELAALGLELELIDATTDLEIPVLLVACRDRRDPDLFVTTLASGRSVPVIVNRLQREVFQIAMHAVLGRPRTSGAVAEHFAAYQHRDRNRLAAFMTASSARSDFAAHRHFAASPDESTRDELARLVEGLHRRGHRAIAVDLTSSWLRALGLYAVRVVVPGLQPIHFGRGNRVLGGRRLYEAPRRMGYCTRDAAIDELNPAEHPF
jgi:ribosomal protein S12 methylthiotransferase accessory factor